MLAMWASSIYVLLPFFITDPVGKFPTIHFDTKIWRWCLVAFLVFANRGGAMLLGAKVSLHGDSTLRLGTGCIGGGLYDCRESI